MHTSPSLSILIPVRNGMPYLRECVESVLSQCYDDWEIVISDNCSTDDTIEYLDTLENPKIRIYKQSANLGIFGNLNFVFQQAKAPFTQILCADDTLLPHGLTTIMKEWENTAPDVALLRFNWEVRRLGGDYDYAYLPELTTPKSSDLKYFLFDCLQGNLTNVTVRTHIIAECGQFSQNFPYAGDFEFWIRMSRKHSWKFVDDMVAMVRCHPGQGSATLNTKLELLDQQLPLRIDCYQQLQGQVDQFWLRVRGSYQYCRFVHQAVRIAIHKKEMTALKKVWAMAANPSQLSPFCTFLLYFFSLNARLGQKYTINKILNSWNVRNHDDLRVL